MSSAHPAGSSRARPRNRARSDGGASGPVQSTITFTRSEYLTKVRSTNVPMWPGKTGLRQLDNMAAIFEQYRFDRLSVTLKPTVGATASGQYFAGFTFEADHYPTSQADIANCGVRMVHPVAMERSLACPVRQLMGSPWLPTYAKTGEGATGCAGYFNLASDQDVGVWFTYTVTLSGPTSVARTGDSLYSYSKKNQQWKLEKDGASTPVTYTEANTQGESLDIEIDSGNSATVDAVVAGIRGAWQNFREVHRTVVDGITYIHALSDFVNRYALPAMGAALIIHRRALPFRADPRLLRGLGFSGGVEGAYQRTCTGKCGASRTEPRPAGDDRIPEGTARGVRVLLEHGTERGQTTPSSSRGPDKTGHSTEDRA